MLKGETSLSQSTLFVQGRALTADMRRTYTISPRASKPWILLSSLYTNMESTDTRPVMDDLETWAGSRYPPFEAIRITMGTPFKGDKDEPCPICYSPLSGTKTLTHIHCGRSFHFDCLQDWFSETHPCKCPLDREQLTARGDDVFNKLNPSPKQVLIREAHLRAIREREAGTEESQPASLLLPPPALPLNATTPQNARATSRDEQFALHFNAMFILS